MDKLIIPASITLEKGMSTQRYRWKSDSTKESVYKRPTKRAFIRFSCRNFADKLSKMSREKRQVTLNFIDNSHIELKRINKRGINLQGYSGKHPVVQFIVNSALPKEFRNRFDEIENKSKSFPIDVIIDLHEWKSLNISPYDFLIEVEKDAKHLMKQALKRGFTIDKISKGRAYDLHLIRPDTKELIIAISSHTARVINRSKEKRIQKILMDISKMLPYIFENKKAIPVILSQPIKSEKTWSYTTQNYLNFYKDKFGFRFLTTDFSKGWEDNVINQLFNI